MTTHRFTPAQILALFAFVAFVLPSLACTNGNDSTHCNFNQCGGSAENARNLGKVTYTDSNGDTQQVNPGLTDGLNGSSDSTSCGIEYVDGAFVTVCK